MVERATSKLSNRNIAISCGTKEALTKIGNTNHIEVIPGGVDFNNITATSGHHIPSDIIFAGRLIKEKNLDLLIKAVNIVKKSVPNVNCLIIGDGPERESLMRLVGELNLGENIHFEPFFNNQSTLYSYMKGSRVFVLPSIREGFGICVLEANACGLPVITTNHARNEAKALITKDNGFISELAPQKIAGFIMLALEKDMKKDCINYVKKFDWDLISDNTEYFFLRSLNKTSP